MTVAYREELLAALRGLLADWDDHWKNIPGDDPENVATARAVIAKVEGRCEGRFGMDIAHHKELGVYSKPVFADQEWPRYYTHIPGEWPAFMIVRSAEELTRVCS